MYYPNRSPVEFVYMGTTVAMAVMLTVLAYFFIYLLNLNAPTLIIGDNIFGFLMAEPIHETTTTARSSYLLKSAASLTPKGWHAPLFSEEGGLTSTGPFIVRRSSNSTYDFQISKTSGIILDDSTSLQPSVTIGETSNNEDGFFLSPILKNSESSPHQQSIELLTSTSVKVSYHSEDENNVLNIYINQLFPYVFLEFNGTISINKINDERIIPIKRVAELGSNYLVMSNGEDLIFHCKFNRDVQTRQNEDGEILITTTTGELTEGVFLPVMFHPWIHLDSLTVQKIFQTRLSKSYRGCISNTHRNGQCILSYVSEDNTGQLVFVPSLTMLNVGKLEHAEPIRLEGGSTSRNFWHNTDSLSRVYISNQGVFSVTYNMLKIPSYEFERRSGKITRTAQQRLNEMIEIDQEALDLPNGNEDDITTYAKKLYTYSNYLYITSKSTKKKNEEVCKFFEDIWSLGYIHNATMANSCYILLSYYIISMLKGDKFLDKNQLRVLELIKLVVSQPYEEDQWFDITRGITPSSSSEVLHTYYACYLIADKWKDPKLSEYFRTLLSIEIPTQNMIKFFGLRDGPVRNFFQRMVSTGGVTSLINAEAHPVATQLSRLGHIQCGTTIDVILPQLLSPLTPLTDLIIDKDIRTNLDSYLETTFSTTANPKFLPTTYPRYVAFRSIFLKDKTSIRRLLDYNLGNHRFPEVIPDNYCVMEEQLLPHEYSNTNTFVMLIKYGC